MKILVTRKMGNGDVLLATSVLPAIKEKWPDSQLTFSTSCGDLLFGNPYVDEILNGTHKRADPKYYDRVIRLDYAYEKFHRRPILESYAKAAEVPIEKCQMFLRCDPIPFSLPNEYVVMHAGSTPPWVGRDWRYDRFAEISRRIQEKYFPVILIGDQWPNRTIKDTIDLQHKLNKQQLATLIKNARLFVGIDSFPMHVAQLFGVPGLAFFGCIDPQLRLYSPQMEGVYAKHLPCIGCHHRNSTPYMFLTECLRDDIACETEVSVDHFWERVQARLA